MKEKKVKDFGVKLSKNTSFVLEKRFNQLEEAYPEYLFTLIFEKNKDIIHGILKATSLDDSQISYRASNSTLDCFYGLEGDIKKKLTLAPMLLKKAEL